MVLTSLNPAEMERIEPCQGCKWLVNVGDYGACNYYFQTGERRGCKPGKGCKRYELESEPRKSTFTKNAALGGNRYIPSPKWDVAEGLRLYLAGKNYADIGRILETSRKNVNRYSLDHGWPELRELFRKAVGEK